MTSDLNSSVDLDAIRARMQRALGLITDQVDPAEPEWWATSAAALETLAERSLPALIAEVERLRRERDAYAAANAALSKEAVAWREKWQREVGDVSGDIAELRAQRQAALDLCALNDHGPGSQHVSGDDGPVSWPAAVRAALGVTE